MGENPDRAPNESQNYPQIAEAVSVYPQYPQYPPQSADVSPGQPVQYMPPPQYIPPQSSSPIQYNSPQYQPFYNSPQPYMGGTFNNQGPISASCPFCHAEIVTNVKHEPGALTFVACMIIFCVFWPCSFIPFLVPACMDSKHYCPNCLRRLN